MQFSFSLLIHESITGCYISMYLYMSIVYQLLFTDVAFGVCTDYIRPRG